MAKENWSTSHYYYCFECGQKLMEDKVKNNFFCENCWEFVDKKDAKE